jgi:hypothetical protein
VNDPTFSIPNVGVLVEGAPESPRKLARWRELLTAYADLELDTDREAYQSHFVFTDAMTAHYKANGRSVAGYAGPCWASYLAFDFDRHELADALADARKLVEVLLQRFPVLDGVIPVFFSGSKGFHVYLELCHEPPPAVGFNAVCRTLAEGLAMLAGVKIDTSIYDANRILRLPNSRHPKTGLFKKRIDAADLFKLDVATILDMARQPAGDGMPFVGDRDAKIGEAWEQAERETFRQREARATVRRDAVNGDKMAPRYFVEFLRFGVPEGDRRPTLFRCAAWMTEQGAPPALVHAMLTEPGRDMGLTPKDTTRQIECGIAHARQQAGQRSEGGPPA